MDTGHRERIGGALFLVILGGLPPPLSVGWNVDWFMKNIMVTEMVQVQESYIRMCSGVCPRSGNDFKTRRSAGLTGAFDVEDFVFVIRPPNVPKLVLIINSRLVRRVLKGWHLMAVEDILPGNVFGYMNRGCRSDPDRLEYIWHCE